MTAAFNLSQFANKVNTSGQADLTTAVTGTLPVANGGTGLTSPGTSGNVLQSNGTAWTSATIAIFAGDSAQVFTASGTFTIPAGITKVKATVVGGGANGQGTYSACGGYYSGGSGGAGGAAVKWFTGLTPGATITVTRGGVGGTSSISSGTQTITTISCTGGASGSGYGVGGSGGSASGGDINVAGQNGEGSAGLAGSPAFGMGLGGLARSLQNANGIAGVGYGAGGSAGIGGGGATSGGAGTGGVIIFEW